MSRTEYGITALTEQVNDWCSHHRVQPLHNGASSTVTVRNIRYYQTLGLVDRPVRTDGNGFTEKHRLQVIAIRLLQAKGLPLEKIQRLLHGRTEEELSEIERDGVEKANLAPAPQPPRGIDWRVIPVADDILLMTRTVRDLTAAQRLKIQEIVKPEPTEIVDSEGLGVESFRPETD
jgi:DNA-binding transcriptional MerR regulator